MHRTLGAVLVLTLVAGLATGGGGGKKDDGKKDKEKFKGTWNVTAFEGGGKKKDVKAGEMSLTFTEDKVVFKGGGKGADEEAAYKINPDPNPGQIDLIKKAEAKEKAGKETAEGIYQFDEDNADFLKLGFSARGARGKRPLNFDAPDVVIMYLKRPGKP